MTLKSSNVQRFTISLRENGIHSLERGVTAYADYTARGDKLLLKDAIMFLHHGIELLMKEILVQTSPYLIFEDLTKAAQKQREADKQSIDIFSLKNPPKTVTYEEAINRVAVFIKPAELSEQLVNDLIELNRLRNQLEHYAIEADESDLVKLLSDLQDPLLELFEKRIGGVKKSTFQKVNQGFARARMAASQAYAQEQVVADLMKKFRGQKVSGKLFNFDSEVTLPQFSKVEREFESLSGLPRWDIIGKGDEVSWLVEVKGKSGIETLLQTINFMGNYKRLPRTQAWLVVFNEISSEITSRAKLNGIFITGQNEWLELAKTIGD